VLDEEFVKTPKRDEDEGHGKHVEDEFGHLIKVEVAESIF